MTTNKIDLKALRELAEKANQGAWTYGAEAVCEKLNDLLTISSYQIIARCPKGERDSISWNLNGAYISAANPQTLLALINRVETAERERDDLKKQIGNMGWMP